MSFIQGVSFVAPSSTAALSQTAFMCQDIWWQLQCWGHWQKEHTVHAGVAWFCYCIQSIPLPSLEKNIRYVISKQTDDMSDSSHNCVEIFLFCIHNSFDQSMSYLHVVITSSGHQKLCTLHYSSMQVHHYFKCNKDSTYTSFIVFFKNVWNKHPMHEKCIQMFSYKFWRQEIMWKTRHRWKDSIKMS